MKFLVDESVEYSVVTQLRNQGNDVYSIAKDSSAVADTEVLSIAYKHKRILVTNDKDFGDLIFRLHLPHSGVILFRLSQDTAQTKMTRLTELIKKFKHKLPESFVVVTSFAPFVNRAQGDWSFAMVHLEGVPAATFQVGFDSWKVCQKDKSAKLVFMNFLGLL